MNESLRKELLKLISIAENNNLELAADFIRDAFDEQARDKMKRTLNSRTNLDFATLVAEMNPRQTRMFERIGHEWTQVYMAVQYVDLKHFEELGLIELRKVDERIAGSNVGIRWEAKKVKW